MDIAVEKSFFCNTTSIAGECSCIQLLHYNSVLLNNIFISGRRRLLWWCFRREGERKKLSHFPRLPCVLLLNMAVSPILVLTITTTLFHEIVVTSRESTPTIWCRPFLKTLIELSIISFVYLLKGQIQFIILLG